MNLDAIKGIHMYRKTWSPGVRFCKAIHVIFLLLKWRQEATAMKPRVAVDDLMLGVRCRRGSCIWLEKCWGWIISNCLVRITILKCYQPFCQMNVIDCMCMHKYFYNSTALKWMLWPLIPVAIVNHSIEAPFLMPLVIQHTRIWTLRVSYYSGTERSEFPNSVMVKSEFTQSLEQAPGLSASRTPTSTPSSLLSSSLLVITEHLALCCLLCVFTVSSCDSGCSLHPQRGQCIFSRSCLAVSIYQVL